MSPLCSRNVKGWYVHHPGQVMDAQRICEIMGDGVLIYEAQSKEDGDNILRKIKQQRHIRSEDRLYISPKREDYKSTVVRISREHKHPDEEVRYFEKGTGYLDVRDPSDQWLRIQVYPGNLIVLPPDVYHRFYPVTDKEEIVVRRMFGEVDVWTADFREN
ncbi:1,2-dihydroxy-3-keto-5-methylthiopentene dioxygenase-like isoform X1 [Ixodes scapularis]